MNSYNIRIRLVNPFNRGIAQVANSNRPVIVAGGGIGGAAAALALANAGFRVQLIERAPEFGVIGYGIQLGPNVFPMFDRLGISGSILRNAIVPNAVLMLDSVDAGVIARIPTGDSFLQRFRRPYIVIHRVDLHRALLDACEANSAIELLPLTGAASYEISSDRVRVRTDDGQVLDGAALIGADGLRSTVRAQMLTEGEPRMTGFVCLLYTSPSPRD